MTAGDSKNRQDKLNQVLKDLQIEYLVKFPGKIKLLKTLTAAQDWVQIENEYHKLKGTGKTYGFPEISVLGEKLEHLALLDFPRKREVFENAIPFFEKLHQAYLENKSYDLTKDPFSRSVLALKTN
jgi:HPt (histidine-containing phosphotransfer) domain-containing protein